jgi:TPR repeat protein
LVPVVIAVLGVVVVLGAVFIRRSDRGRQAEIGAVRAEVVARTAVADDYQGHLQNLRWRAGKIRAWAETQTAEPVKSWARKRAQLFDELVRRVERPQAEREFADTRAAIDRLCAEGRAEEARALLAKLPLIAFPRPADFLRLQNEAYLGPLATASRQTPETYRAFQEQEGEAAKVDIAALRREFAAENTAKLTPRQMFELELLSAVVPADDPVVADWAAVASAGDFFENTDGATLGHWRAAQQATRKQDWKSAAAHMQSILRTTVRTRQPFRAAYGRTLLKGGAENKAEAYPFMEEAAAAGDREARAWLAGEDLAAGRRAQALRRLEASALDGEPGAVPRVLELYAMSQAEVPRDAAREAGVLQRILSGPDAPPEAAFLLARLYASGEGVTASPQKAFACYLRAGEKGLVAAWPEIARRCLRGAGVAEDAGRALNWAGRAYAAGEREQCVPILIELMEQKPERATGAIAELLERENVAAPAGFAETRVEAPGVTKLRTLVAKRLDQQGRFGQAARFYAASAKSDPAVARRHAELTVAHPCEACGGTGKVRVAVPCPTCAGKGEMPCGVCGARGYTFAPGPPPCATCAGSGTVMQEGRPVKCSGCEGTGKGRDSVTRKECTFCRRGQVPCPDCTQGKQRIMKECPECRGAGHWAMTDRGAP